MKNFSAFLDMTRIGLIRSTPENIYLKTCPASFPRAQSASSLLSTLKFRERSRSAAAAAHDSILVEGGGRRQFVDTCLCFPERKLFLLTSTFSPLRSPWTLL